MATFQGVSYIICWLLTLSIELKLVPRAQTTDPDNAPSFLLNAVVQRCHHIRAPCCLCLACCCCSRSSPTALTAALTATHPLLLHSSCCAPCPACKTHPVLKSHQTWFEQTQCAVFHHNISSAVAASSRRGWATTAM